MQNFCDQCDKELKVTEHCATCGVYYTGKSATFKSLFSDGMSQFLSMEKGSLQTILLSFKNPRRLVLSYYEGYRNRYASPGRILVFTLLALGLIYYLGDSKESARIKIEENEDLLDPLSSLKLTLILLIPYLSISSKIVFYKKVDSWVIHIISMIYLFLPRLLLFTIVLNLLPFVVNLDALTTILLFVMLISTLAANTRVFYEDVRLFKALFLGFIQFCVLVGLIVFTILILSQLFVEWNFTFLKGG